MMVDRLAAQGASPRVTIVQWDVPIGINACDKGACAPIDVEKAPNLKKLPAWALGKNTPADRIGFLRPPKVECFVLDLRLKPTDLRRERDRSHFNRCCVRDARVRCFRRC